MRAERKGRSHYAFSAYVTKGRWISYWHQLDEVVNLAPAEVLEVGVGAGVFTSVARVLGLKVTTLDCDPSLEPDHVASVLSLPFDDRSFDVVVAFQMLEHLPYEDSISAVGEMARVAKRHLVISLPEIGRFWRFVIHVPRRGPVAIAVPRPSLWAKDQAFGADHRWELDKAAYRLDKVVCDFSRAGLRLTKTFRVPENLYHRFLVFEKTT